MLTTRFLTAVGFLVAGVLGAAFGVPAFRGLAALRARTVGVFLAFAAAAGWRGGRLGVAFRAADARVVFAAGFRRGVRLVTFGTVRGAVARARLPVLARLRLDGGLRRAMASSIPARN